MADNDAAVAERLVHRRVRVARILAVLLLTTQMTAFEHDGLRAVDTARHLAWVLWCVATCVFIVTGGALIRRPAVRALMNDESTIDHRRRAFSFGFWVALTACGGLWIMALHTPVSAREALRLVVTASIAAALLRFASLEKKSLKGE